MTLTTAVGLCVALFGPPVIALLGPQLEATLGEPKASLAGLAGFGALLAGAFAIVIAFEHRPLSSIGLHPLRWQAIALGLGLALFFIYVFTPIVVWGLARLPLGGFDTGLARASMPPKWVLVLSILIVATAEEILYRGFAVAHLLPLTGNYWSAGAIAVLVFGAAHLPNWGLGASLTTVVSGAILTAVYIWQQDLAANIIAHLVTDFVGLIVTPALNARRQRHATRARPS